MKHNEHKGLAEAVYYSKIKKEVEAKYLNRIEYLVNANNELMKELQRSEKQVLDILSGKE